MIHVIEIYNSRIRNSDHTCDIAIVAIVPVRSHYAVVLWLLCTYLSNATLSAVISLPTHRFTTISGD